MSILDNDNGLENQFFDPFATVSQEAYAFPVEDFIPVAEAKIVEDVPAVIPTETPIEDEPVEVARALAVTEEEASPAEIAEITDTPQAPAEDPDKEGETRISFELDENAADEADSNLGQLIEVRDRIMEMGGVCKDDIYQVESHFPGLVTDKVGINRFSSMRTPMGVDVSLESIGGEILNVIKKLLAAIRDMVKGLLTGIADALDKKASGTSQDKVQHDWKNVLDRAARVDSLKGREAFRRKFPDEPAAKKASTTGHFVRLYAIEKLKAAPFTKGYRLAQQGQLIDEIQEIERTAKSLTDTLRSAVGDIKVGKAKALDLSKFKPYIEAAEFKGHIGTVRAMLREPSDSIKQDFENAIKIKDGVEVSRNTAKTLREAISGFQSDLSAAESNLEKHTDANAVRATITQVRLGIAALTRMVEKLHLYTTVYGRYYSLLLSIVGQCERATLSIV